MKDLSNIKDKISKLGLKNIPLSENVDILKEKIMVGDFEVNNRLAIQPMEGCDANPDGTPHELTIRRYERFAEGGAGLIWAEAVAVMKEGRANPRQLYICDENIDSFKKMVEDTKNITMKKFGFEPMIIMQATHSGRYSKPNGFPEPLIAYNNPIFEKDNPISKDRILSDDYLKRLEEQYGVAAIQAQKAGFDGIDIKCCHRYLLCELLSAYEREGEFGGSLENRSRLLINGVKNAKTATDNKFLVTTRMNIYDGFPYPYGFGVKEGNGVEIDLTEPKKVIEILHKELNVPIIDITIGNPYFNPNVNRPANTKLNLEIENPYIGVDRMYYCIGEIQKAFPELIVVGSGVSYLNENAVNLAAGAIENGYCKIQGFGRMAFAYPDFAKDIVETGELNKSKCCLACGKCTELMRAGSVTGCVIRDDIYKELYKEVIK